MLINARINKDVEFEVQTNREELTSEDIDRLNEIINNTMNGDYDKNVGFSVSVEGRTFDTYQFDIKSDSHGDDLHSAFEQERIDYDNALDKAEFEIFKQEQETVEQLNQELDKALADFDSNDNWGDSIKEAINEGLENAESTVATNEQQVDSVGAER